jgi:hypothetical protein
MVRAAKMMPVEREGVGEAGLEGEGAEADALLRLRDVIVCAAGRFVRGYETGARFEVTASGRKAFIVSAKGRALSFRACGRISCLLFDRRAGIFPCRPAAVHRINVRVAEAPEVAGEVGEAMAVSAST